VPASQGRLLSSSLTSRASCPQLAKRRADELAWKPNLWRLRKLTINYVPQRAVGVLLTPVDDGQSRITMTGPNRKSRPLTAQWHSLPSWGTDV
jgi:hypothetical protein